MAGEEEKKVEFRASHRYARMSPRKARPVLNLIRGQGVNRAIEILDFENRRAAAAARKVLRSALANAEAVIQDRHLDIDPDELLVSDARVDVGPTLKRWLPRARGMATPILKRTCHISIALSARPAAPEVDEGKEKRPRKARSGPARPAAAGTGKAEGEGGSAGKRPGKPPGKTHGDVGGEGGDLGT